MAVSEMDYMNMFKDIPMYFHQYGQVTGATNVNLTNVIGKVQFVYICTEGTGTSLRCIAAAPSGSGYVRKTTGFAPAIASGGGFTQSGTTVTVSTGTSSSITFDAYYWSDTES